MMLVKEELVQYLIKGYIHVSRQDYLFFNNLSKFIGDRNVTSGQSKLLDKLIDKYQKQLRNNNLNPNILKSLPWRFPLIETLPEYLKTYVAIVNNKEITVRNPFSKKFISALQRSHSNLVWDKKRKLYSAELSTYNLKQTLDLVSKNFNEFVYCDTIQKLLDEIKQYDNCYWNPTLVKVGDNFYIAAINEALHNVISAELNDNPKTLFALSKHGVNIETYLLSTEAQKFASSHSYNIDIDEIDILINFLHDLSINKVAIEGVALYRDSLYKEILNKFKQNDIEVISNSNNDYEMPSAPVLISFRNSHIIYNPGKASKIVLIKNSRPVHVK